MEIKDYVRMDDAHDSEDILFNAMDPKQDFIEFADVFRGLANSGEIDQQKILSKSIQHKDWEWMFPLSEKPAPNISTGFLVFCVFDEKSLDVLYPLLDADRLYAVDKGYTLYAGKRVTMTDFFDMGEVNALTDPIYSVGMRKFVSLAIKKAVEQARLTGVMFMDIPKNRDDPRLSSVFW